MTDDREKAGRGKPAGIENKIEAVITGETQEGALCDLLGFLSRGYGGVMTLRAELYKRGILARARLPRPVISVGNITMGGTGKTPMTIHLVSLLKEMGLIPAVVTRGYRGGLEKKGGIVGTGKELLCGPETAGDEPWMMARNLEVPVVVGKDRYRSGGIAVQAFEPDVIVLDDGFQHQKLHRDLDIVLLDASKPFGNGFLTPRGTLREPAKALCRGDIFVLTRSNLAEPSELRVTEKRIRALAPGKPVLFAEHEPSLADTCNFPRGDGGDLTVLAGKRAHAFSGIAGNAGFFDAVKEAGCLLSSTRAFGDHHPYTKAEIGEITEQARAAGADLLVTTEKDYVRIRKFEDALGGFPLAVMGVGIRFTDGGRAFSRMIGAFLASPAGPFRSSG